MKSDVQSSADKLRRAACDPNSPIYGSNLVPWIDDVTTEYTQLRILLERVPHTCVISGSRTNCLRCEIDAALNDPEVDR